MRRQLTISGSKSFSPKVVKVGKVIKATREFGSVTSVSAVVRGGKIVDVHALLTPDKTVQNQFLR